MHHKFQCCHDNKFEFIHEGNGIPEKKNRILKVKALLFQRFDLLSFIIVAVQTVQLLGSYGNCLSFFNSSEQALLDLLYPVKCPANDSFR